MKQSELYHHILNKVTVPDSLERFRHFENKTFAIRSDIETDCCIWADVTLPNGRVCVYAEIPNPDKPDAVILFKLNTTYPFNPNTILDVYANAPEVFAHSVTKAIVADAPVIETIIKNIKTPRILAIKPV